MVAGSRSACIAGPISLLCWPRDSCLRQRAAAFRASKACLGSLLLTDPEHAAAERVGPRAAAGGAAASVTALTFLLWYYGSFWPGVPSVAEGRFTLRQVHIPTPNCPIQ